MQTSIQLTKATVEQVEYLKRRGFGTRTDIVRLAIDRMAREENTMTQARFYIEVDSYWANSESVFVGPYATRDEAQAAADASRAIPANQMAPDVKHNVRYEIHNTGQAKQAGMNDGNIISNLDTAVPNDTAELARLVDMMPANWA